MSYRSGFGGGYPSKKPVPSGTTSKGYSMNAVPPPSSLNSHRGSAKQTPQKSSLANYGDGQQINLSKHGYSTMDSIAQFANSSQYALGKRKSRTEDE